MPSCSFCSSSSVRQPLPKLPGSQKQRQLPSLPQPLQVLFWGLSKQQELPALCPSGHAHFQGHLQASEEGQLTRRTWAARRKCPLLKLGPPGPAAILPASLPANYASVTEFLLCPQRDPQKPSTNGMIQAEKSVHLNLSLVKINTATGTPCTSP